MKLFGLTIMTSRALAESMKVSVAGGVALGRVIGRHNLQVSDEQTAADLSETADIYECGVAAGKALAEQEASDRTRLLRLAAADRSRQRRDDHGRLRVVIAGDDIA